MRKHRDRDLVHFDMFKKQYEWEGKEKLLGEEFLRIYGEDMLDKDKHAEME